ncbi:hypothetical protein WR25_26457 [Diploscapter pachys]|uniref:Uncharacterized protein n=1 Tax=Diploscapter pachys TaxID=2018661 RepID=A0A2A2KD84_9BILA|nr:hypothetical protein WR25_26457 [Diploscapter pachys]
MGLQDEPMDVVAAPNANTTMPTSSEASDKPTIPSSPQKQVQRCSDTLMKERVKQASKWIEQMDADQRELFLVLLMVR